METVTTRYALQLTGDLSPHLSRWLWLVKWVLVIPHLVVLCFLWIAFVMVSGIAFFAILITGRYPPPALQLHGRRTALELARGLLQPQRTRHRSLSTVHPQGRPGLPGTAGGHLPRLPLGGWCR